MRNIIKKIDKILYNDFIMGTMIIIIFLFLASMTVGFFVTFKDGFKFVFGSAYVFFFPGFLISFIVFPDRKYCYYFLERIVLSVTLSISTVTLFVFYFNLLGGKILFINIIYIVSLICFISAIIITSKKFFKKREKGKNSEISN